MFQGIIKTETGTIFKINNKEVECPTQYNKVIIEKIIYCPKKVVTLFKHIINERMNTQDLMDFNMDEDIDWKFIKDAISISRLITKG